MHDLDEDHGHENFEIGPDAIVEDIEGLEMFTLKSVGIDIGSSTSHLVFSQLILRREGASLSGRFKVTERKVLFRSTIMLTPYFSGTLIDIEKVKRFIEGAYKEAGLTPADIDTGAVIITGEALKKENAQPIVEYFAGHSGKFICAAPATTTRRSLPPMDAAPSTSRRASTGPSSMLTWGAGRRNSRSSKMEMLRKRPRLTLELVSLPSMISTW